ncbi:hypothetical protein SLE2022_055090 [Rubroshorea leprosula]
MGKSAFLIYHVPKKRYSSSFKAFSFFLPICLGFTTFFLVLIYIYTTSGVLTNPHSSPYLEPTKNSTLIEQTIPFSIDNTAEDLFFDLPRTPNYAKQSQWSISDLFRSIGDSMNNTDIYHDTDIFLEDYKEMNKSFKIFVYPHTKDDPFANVLLPVDFDPKGHYASELYFKKALFNSHFITKNPNEADLFYMPFSIAEMRHDPRIGPEGLQDFIRAYIFNIGHKFPYWNRTNGADHFYVACHSIGRVAMDKAAGVKFNAIQVVCSSTYFVAGYFPHKDISMPQIWPKERDPPSIFLSKRRKQLAFFAGSVNSLVRVALLKHWRNDSEIFAHFGRFKTDDGEQLLRSKFCLHVKGFEVNAARITDALHYGCVPVILANHCDLPFADILNWKSFSVIVHYMDIPVLKKILQGISLDEYSWLQSNAVKVRKHFHWNVPPVDYDAFYMAMYDLWLRRSSIRVRLTASLEYM